jgi:hypothetical protein
MAAMRLGGRHQRLMRKMHLLAGLYPKPAVLYVLTIYNKRGITGPNCRGVNTPLKWGASLGASELTGEAHSTPDAGIPMPWAHLPTCRSCPLANGTGRRRRSSATASRRHCTRPHRQTKRTRAGPAESFATCVPPGAKRRLVSPGRPELGGKMASHPELREQISP